MNDGGWTVSYVNEQAEQEVLALPDDIQTSLARLLLKIAAVGVQRLREPHAKNMGDGLWELRFGGKAGIARSLYVTASGRRVVILHSFVKKTMATPSSALHTARRRMKLVKP